MLAAKSFLKNVTQILKIGSYAYTSDSDTVLLIHSDTSDEATSYTDSASNHTINRNGTVNHDTAQQVIGATSIRFGGGSGDWLNTGNHADWQFGTGPFTIDFWVYHNASIADNDVMMQYYNTGSVFQDHWTFQIGTTTLAFHSKSNNNYLANYSWTVPNSGWATDRWYHVAVVRNGASVYGFIDGVSITPESGYTAPTTSTNFPDQGADLTIGKGHYSNRMFQGWMDEIRISKGSARWTSDFAITNAN